MGDIIESRRRHYVGVDADKDSIPAGSKDPGDSYHANDKGKQYYWNGAAWKTGLGYEYVSREPVGWDKSLVDFTTDGNPHVNGLDLSGIVPAGAVGVVLGIEIVDDAANSAVRIYTNAGAILSGAKLKTQVANITFPGNVTMAIDADRLLDYEADNLVFTSISLAVLGWFI